jgi:hypothetical protein
VRVLALVPFFSRCAMQVLANALLGCAQDNRYEVMSS